MSPLSDSGLVVWLTGLSGAGKSTLSDLFSEAMRSRGVPVVQIDGDALRGGVSKDLGYGSEARDENIRRAAEFAKLLVAQGFVVSCSFISPLKRHRESARQIVGERFLEVFVKVSLDQAIARDPKGLYKRALSGELKQFTGVSDPYEEPENADLVLETAAQSPDESLASLVRAVASRLPK